MKFAISSHINYFDKTKDRLLNSLIDVGISLDDIYFFVGGGEIEGYELQSTSPFVYKVPHNSFDFTALISVLELNLDQQWWYLLHDTCYVGPNFYKKIIEKDYTNCNTVRIHGIHDSMNIGAYNIDFLRKHENELLKYKGTNENKHELKRKLIQHEDVIFYLDNQFVFYTRELRSEIGPIDFYGTGTNRKIFYYPDVDIYKIQANWVKKDETDPYGVNL